MTTKIEWTDETWGPTVGCEWASPGCDRCYAARQAAGRLKNLPVYAGLATREPGEPARFTGEVRSLPDRLDKPLHWRRPRMVFVDSMSDLFHPKVPTDFIVDVLAVMALTPQHSYQVLTKRPKRMAAIFNDPTIPGRVARAADRVAVRREIDRMGEERQREIEGFPGYWVTDRGRVLLEGGSDSCVWCGTAIPDGRSARAKFCAQECNAKAHYEALQGRWEEPVTFREMRPDQGEHGHHRVVMTGADGLRHRRAVHRLVLSHFRRPPQDDEQACHRDGDPTNNALPNLRWGTQEDNWADRIRHGNGQSHSRLSFQEVLEIRSLVAGGARAPWVASEFGVSDTQIRNIVRGDQWAERVDWPLPSLWVGTSIESDDFTWRADVLRQTPAAVRFVSAEPLLGPLPSLDLTGIGWLIVGGESGDDRGVRPMHPDWVRDLRDLCCAPRPAGEPTTAFFLKQWGEWAPVDGRDMDHRRLGAYVEPDGSWRPAHEALPSPEAQHVRRVGKKAAGRELDGRTWDEYPVAR